MKIALFGNPNTGKSSVFNFLTGMRQHVGNFPGVTVDLKSGVFRIKEQEHTLIDFPGTYSIYPRSNDERVVYEVLNNPQHKHYPDLALVVVDAANLERNLFLFTQIYDLKIPTILVLNMSDVASRKGSKIDLALLAERFPLTRIVETNARVGLGIDRLREAIADHDLKKADSFFLPGFQLAPIDNEAAQSKEAGDRFDLIRDLLPKILHNPDKSADKRSIAIDRFLVHPFWGYFIFAAILMVLFQFIYTFASIPMDFIDGQFAALSGWLQHTLPEGNFSDLLAQGIVPGIGGVVVFVPQIAMLFFFISILEESGYLARVVFIMDRLMRPLGLNGKSVVPLMSSVACAIPGVMATRTISNWKERLITILVAPLMSCSARIPVYTLLIALVIPNEKVFGFVSLQGLTLFALYALGLISALLIAAILKAFIKTSEKSFLMLELPSYKSPRWGNVGLTVWEKVKVFVLDAGKVILSISILLWFLASFGGEQAAEQRITEMKTEASYLEKSPEEKASMEGSVRLEHSYIGQLGKGLEPVIAPLGYDWKIGISLITSFAAREVFVGSLATIYSVQDDGEENRPLIKKLKAEVRPDGKPVYSLATGLSLMVFYVFAMQCMATLAVVKRETKSWKWPILQLLFMGVLAYSSAFFTYQIFS
jgi:ferrous iron transport protein B